MATEEQIREARNRAVDNRWLLVPDPQDRLWRVYESIWDVDEGTNVLGEGMTPDGALVDALGSLA